MANTAHSRKTTLIILLDQMIVSGANFITGFMLARFLGAEGYGQYVLAYGFLMFVSGMQMALVISPMMVTGPGLNPADAQRYYRSLFTLQIFFNLTVSAAVYGFAQAIDDFYPAWNVTNLLIPLSAATFCCLTQDYIRRYLIADHLPRRVLINDLLFHGGRVLGLAYLGYTQQLDTETAFNLLTLASGLSMLMGTYTIYRRNLLSKQQANHYGQLALEHWHYGKWLIGNNINYLLGNQLITYIVGAVVSIATVGAMNAALNIVGITNVFFMTLDNLVPIRAARTYASQGLQALNRYLRKIALLGGGVTLGILAVACIWAEDWLRLLYKDQFAGNGWMLYGWSAYYLFSYFQKPFIFGMRVLRDTKGIFIANVISTLIVFSSSYWVITHYQALGAILLLCLFNLIILVAMAHRYWRVNKLPTIGN